jgi:hypothetical protein
MKDQVRKIYRRKSFQERVSEVNIQDDVGSEEKVENAVEDSQELKAESRRPTLVREREIIDFKQASMQPPSNVPDQTHVIREEINESDEEESSGPDHNSLLDVDQKIIQEYQRQNIRIATNMMDDITTVENYEEEAEEKKSVQQVSIPP